MDVASRLRDILDEAYDRLGLLGPAAEKAKREMLTVEEEVAELIDEAIGDAADEYTHDDIDDDFLAVHAREIELIAEHIGTGNTAEALRELHDLFPSLNLRGVAARAGRLRGNQEPARCA